MENGDRDQRLRCGTQAQHEERAHDRRGGEERQDGRRQPGMAHTGQVQGQHEGHACNHDQHGAGEIEAMRTLVTGKTAQERSRHRERRQPHGNVDPENHRPMQMIGNEASKQRPEPSGAGVGS